MASTRPVRPSRDIGERSAVLDGEQLATGLPGKPRVEGELEAAHARVLVGGIAGLLELRLLVGIWGPSLPGDVDRVAAERGAAVIDRPGGERYPVAGHDRGAPPDLQTPADSLARREPGEGQARIPGDLAAVQRQSERAVDLAEQPGPDADTHIHDAGAVDALGTIGAAGVDRGRGGGLLGVGVGALQVRGRVLGLRGVGELVVHRL